MIALTGLVVRFEFSPVAFDPFAVFVIVANNPHTVFAAKGLLLEPYTAVFHSIVDLGASNFDSLAGFYGGIFNGIARFFSSGLDSFAGFLGSGFNCFCGFLTGFFDSLTDFTEETYLLFTTSRLVIALSSEDFR